MVALGASAALWATAACGGVESGVVAAEGGNGDETVAGVEEERDAVERIETVDTEATSSELITQSGGADAASVAGNEAVAGTLSPEELSTGPVLEWMEIELDIPYGFSVHSTSDGRVVAFGGEPPTESSQAASHVLVTDDGVDWTRAALPSAIFPTSVDMSDQRWAISGLPAWETTLPDADRPLLPPIFISDDEGATWAQATFASGSVESDTLEYAIVEGQLASVFVSGDRIVAAVQTFTDLDVETLLIDKGLLPPGTQFGGWEGEPGGVRIWLADGGVEESELWLSYDDLGLSVDQRALLERRPGAPRLELFAGSDAELAPVGSFDGWALQGSATDEGFLLVLLTGEGSCVLSSLDGSSWTTQLLDRPSAPRYFNIDAVAPDGTLWTGRSGDTGSSIHRWRAGEAIAQTAAFPGIEALHGMTAGPAGVVVGGLVGLTGTATAGENDLPDGTIVKGSYELRVNQPEGGMTLWDQTTDEAVYVFGADVMQRNETPPGVRSEGLGDTQTLTFEDPETGEDLVTFTMSDLLQVWQPPVLADPAIADRIPEVWVGWSTDGAEWGWATVEDAFGIGDASTTAAATFAVGSDFVVALVTAVPTVAGAADASQSSFDWPQAPRWFIARVP